MRNVNFLFQSPSRLVSLQPRERTPASWRKPGRDGGRATQQWPSWNGIWLDREGVTSIKCMLWWYNSSRIKKKMYMHDEQTLRWQNEIIETVLFCIHPNHLQSSFCRNMWQMTAPMTTKAERKEQRTRTVSSRKRVSCPPCGRSSSPFSCLSFPRDRRTLPTEPNVSIGVEFFFVFFSPPLTSL